MHIVFKILQQHSHLNATFKLASMLLAKNYRVTYSGLKEFEKEVIAKGFEYYLESDATIPPSSNKRPTFFNKLSYRNISIRRHSQYERSNAFAQIIDDLNPDLIVVDSPIVRNAIPIFETGIPFMIFESMVSLDQSPLHPPLCSEIIPKNTFFNKLLIQLDWKKYYLNLYIATHLFGTGFPPKNSIKKLAKRTNFPIKEIDFNRYFHIGLNNVPEIIASPLEFDFPRKKKSNQYYLGVSVTENRKEASHDLKYNNARLMIEQIVSQNKSCNPEDKVAMIYCSFGSNAGRYEGVAEFYTRLIQSFKSDTNVQIFISIGYEVHYHLFKDMPKHIHVFRKVPQVELLKHMDLMITHGGMNTITECIMAEVPMLAYPGFKDIDQVGNACRVQFHKIGLKGDVKKDSGKLLKHKINTVLTDLSFKENIRKMKNEMLANDNSDEILALFDQMLYSKAEKKVQIDNVQTEVYALADN
jgi:UDP:flavonoid glycosyltransferase YjiC (YdhE family)